MNPDGAVPEQGAAGGDATRGETAGADEPTAGPAPTGQQFRIGGVTTCADGAGGRVARVVIDPVGQVLTHLVVVPDGAALGRLVPLALVADPGPPVRLTCGGSELMALEEAEETHFFAGEPSSGYAGDQVLVWPYLGLGGVNGLGAPGVGAVPPVVYDRVPLGEVEVRRGDPVRASDGDIGRVRGLVVDPADRHVTHVLLEEGHLWGRKQVAIPVSAVRRGDDGGFEVAFRKEEIRDLPPVDLAGD